MRNIDKLEIVKNQLNDLQNEKEEQKRKYELNEMSYKTYYNYLPNYENKKRYLEILEQIIKNNMFLEVHNKLLLIYKDIYKKYENKSIGEKRKEEIQEILRNQVANILDFDNENIPYYNKFHLYFSCEIKRDDTRIFNIRIEKLKYDFCYFLENEEIKPYYNYEMFSYVENPEEEAKRLLQLYNDTKNKKDEIEKQLQGIKEEINNNFKKNLNSEDISRLTRSLTLYW